MPAEQPRTDVVRAALVGTGYIADYHRAALALLPGVQLRAVCDLNRRRAERFATDHPELRVYSDLGDMLRSETLDVVHLLTPPPAHSALAAEILGAGVDVLVEKPLCDNVADCERLEELARSHGRQLGASHNFLFSAGYEQLLHDLRQGRLGALDQIDIVWNKELGQLRGGPFGSWLFADPRHILFEVAPHSFAHLVHLVGEPDELDVRAYDRVTVRRGREFYRRWEVAALSGTVGVRLRFSFIEGYPEHYVHVRGTNASATVDFENNTYVRREHSPHLLDVDRYVCVANTARDSMKQATGTLANFVLSKLGLPRPAGPFAESITRAVGRFYETRGGTLDERLGAALATATVRVAERVARAVVPPAMPSEAQAQIGDSRMPPETREQGGNAPNTAAADRPTVLVIGGTGFIGRAVVRALVREDHGVRVLARNPSSAPPELQALGADIVAGDFSDADAVTRALEGITRVVHLGRGEGRTWEDYLRTDVEPTRAVAELCLAQGVERLVYASSIAIYYAGQHASVITEQTPPHPGIARANIYARSKVENERVLRALHRERGLPLVIVRPGIVLGQGGSPYHMGVADWPYKSVCRLWSDGNHKLPLVLVDDVAGGIVRAVTTPGIEGESYNLCSEPRLTANEYLDELERRAGIKLRRIPTSGARFYAEAMAKWTIKTLGRDPHARLPSYGDWEGRSFAARMDCSKAERELGWRPVKDRDTLVREGIHLPVDDHFR